MHFGILTFAARVPVYLSTNIGAALIGRHLNASVLGLYSRAQHLALLPTQQLTTPLSRVMLPTLSRLQNDTFEYNRWVTRTQSLMCLPIAVSYSFGIVFAHELVRVALGPSWDGAVPIFRILAIGGMLESSHIVTYWILVSKGLPKAHLQFSMITRPLLLAMVFVVVPHGVTAIAYAYSLWMIAAWVFGVFWVGRLANVPSWSILQTGLRAYLLSAFVSTTGIIAYGYFQASEHRVGLLATLLTMIASYAGVYLLSPSLRSDTLGILALRHHVRR